MREVETECSTAARDSKRDPAWTVPWRPSTKLSGGTCKCGRSAGKGPPRASRPGEEGAAVRAARPGGAVSVGGRGDTDDRETGEDDKGHPGRGTREGTMPGRPRERSRIKQWGSRAAGRAAGRPGDLREDSLVEAAEAAAGFHGLRGRGQRGRADSERGCLSTALAMKRRRGPGLCLTDTWGWRGGD